MARKIELKIDLGERQDEALLMKKDSPDMRLAEFARTYPEARFLPGEFEQHRDHTLGELTFDPWSIPDGDTPGAGTTSAFRSELDDIRDAEESREMAVAAHGDDPNDYPETICDRSAVLTAYHHELQAIARFLRHDISVLINCDKILTEFIYRHVVAQANKELVLDSDVPEDARPRSQDAGLASALQGGKDAQKAAEAPDLKTIINNLKPNQVLVLRSLEMLDSLELIDVIYHGTARNEKPVLLAFLDPSLEVRKVLTDRFSVHVPLMGLPRHVSLDGKTTSYTVTQLLTRDERKRFAEFDPEELYKHVSGLNAIQFRNAMRYVVGEKSEGTEPTEIYRAIRQFKKSTSDEIEIPEGIDFKSIGGYEHIKQQLQRIFRLVGGPIEGISEKQRLGLIPRGFVFHGPPGTGKTLFAKAIANELNATIQMVSGPEIMDKYVGQSEDNLRRIFATARRNAPAVIFFDEFDSIAGQRSNYSDGGARANNAVVAQLLTELDGFRQDQTVLVIGTTNRIDIIDEALLRPSRLRPVEINNPDYAARRSVADIHGRNFGVDVQLKKLYDQAKDDSVPCLEDGRVSRAWLERLFASHEPYRKRWEIDEQRSAFTRDLRAFFDFCGELDGASSAAANTGNETVQKMKERLVEVGSRYGVVLKADDPPAADDAGGNAEAADDPDATGLLPTMRNDLNGLFEIIDSDRQRRQGSESDAFYQSILELVAEYTEGFNNDEIRAVFQEASLEYHLEGQLLTPRFLGQKIGLIRKRRDEREAVHLANERVRH